jgi:aryl-alcohol dehydrogenase-like predicted oxidoreductase
VDFELPAPLTNRLCIGSAQFGLSYGISNRVGKVSPDAVAAILSAASTLGIDTIDTASAYGDSEQCLGRVGIESWRVITKVSPVPEWCPDAAAWVLDSIEQSLLRLNLSSLYAVLLHHPRQLLDAKGPSIYRGLTAARDRGLCSKIGLSIYSPEDLDAIIPTFDVGIVQGPLNVLDRRLVQSGWLDRLSRSLIEVHVRSVFLQGLLLMSSPDRPEKFRRWQHLWDEWEHWLVQHAMTPIQACVGFALSYPTISRVVIGIESVAQLQEICAAAQPPHVVLPPSISTQDKNLINPSNWNSQ